MTHQHELLVDIEITNYCQAACSSCPRTNTETDSAWDWLKLKHVDADQVCDTVDSIAAGAEPGTDFVIKLCGEWGDPAMHPDLLEIVQYAANNPGVSQIVVNTNGGLRTPEFWTRLGSVYPDKISVVWGIDGTDHATNDLYRRNVNTQRAIENMRAFNDAGFRGEWQYLAFIWNRHDWPRLLLAQEEYWVPVCFRLGSTIPRHKITDPAIMDEFRFIQQQIARNNFKIRGHS